MIFINSQINAAAIPDAEMVNWQPVEKNYLKVLRIQWLIISTVLLIIAGVLLYFIQSLRQLFPAITIGGGWAFVTGFYFILMEKSFQRQAYAVRQHDILYRRGWLMQTIMACPFNRIQHCRTDTGILDRKFKLSSLMLFTAGTDDADLRISGLKQEIAQNLREFIMQKINPDEHADG